MKKTREIKALFIVITGSIVFFTGIKFLSTGHLFESDKIYYTVYNDVKGLQRNAIVKFNGMSIGNVHDIHFLPNKKLLVSFSMDIDFAISNHSTAHLTDDGLMGDKCISILSEPSDQTLQVGDTLVSSSSSSIKELFNQKMDPSIVKINKMTKSIDDVFISIKEMLNENGDKNILNIVKRLNKTVDNIEVFSNSLVKISKSSDDIITSIENTKDISTNLKNISNTIKNSELKQMISNFEIISKNLTQITNDINSKKGSAGMFIQDKNLYESLNRVSDELDLLIKDLRANPKKYVHFSIFGRKNKKNKDDH